MKGRLVALLLAAVSTVVAVVACITGSGPGNPVTCTTYADQSCSCLADLKADSGTLCPASNTLSDLQCCADLGYPLAGSSCRCDHVPVGCAFDQFGDCTCGVVASDASTTPSCTLPTTWPTCCKSGTTCTCSLAPGGCGDAGAAVPSCSSTDVGGGTCVTSNDACYCNVTTKDAAASCGAPSFDCCIVPSNTINFTRCICSVGMGGCSGAQKVTSCTAASVAASARADTCGFSSRVVTCNPPPDGGGL